MIIQFKLGENAILPRQAKKYDAGYDLFATEELVITRNMRGLVRTNLMWEPVFSPEEEKMYKSLNMGIYLNIADRSGNALKRGLTKMAGVVDATYRGLIGVVLFNTTNENITIHRGEAIAQAIFSPCFYPENIVQVEELSSSERGSLGFGSTGLVGGNGEAV